MPNNIQDMPDQVFIGQSDFSGGMNCVNPQENQSILLENVIIRDGHITTRPGVKGYIDPLGSFLMGFYFNQENSKQSDAEHTGFWFDFDFVRSASINGIQGANIIRLSTYTRNKIIFASGGNVMIYENGYVDVIDTVEAIGDDEEIDFVQANDLVYMFRGEEKNVLFWDGTDIGFVLVPDPDPEVGEPIPKSIGGVYHAGRMWVTNGDDVFASSVLEFDTYDYTNRNWGVWKKQSEIGVHLFPFHEGNLLCFKKDRVVALVGVNMPVSTSVTMYDNVVMQSLDEKRGSLARFSVVSVGEDVWYLGYNGIYSLTRNQQNKMELDPIPVSWPIQVYIDRINWKDASCACSVSFDNYVLFAVPIDNSTTNNAILVYDNLANGGAGAWCGMWTSPALNPVRFFNDDEKLIFLSADGRIRQMFSNDPWDSEDPFQDSPLYNENEMYNGTGKIVGWVNAGDRVYRNIAACTGVDPSDPIYWEEVLDIYSLYRVTSHFKTRLFKLPGIRPSIRFSRADIVFRHQNPKISVNTYSKDHGTDKVIFTDVEYDNTEYDVGGVPDWDSTNINLDFNNPYRKDYTLMIDSNGIWINEEGIYCQIWETHSLKFLPLTIDQQDIGVEVWNDRGRIQLHSIRFMTASRRFATAKMV